MQQGMEVDSHITNALSKSICSSIKNNDEEAIILLEEALYEIDEAIKKTDSNDINQLNQLKGIRFEYLAKKYIRQAIISNENIPNQDTIISDIVDCFVNASKMFEQLEGDSKEYGNVCKGCACLYKSLMHLSNGIRNNKVHYYWKSIRTLKKSKQYYAVAKSTTGVNILDKINDISKLLKEFIDKHSENIHNGVCIKIIEYEQILIKFDELLDEISPIGLKKLYTTYIFEEAISLWQISSFEINKGTEQGESKISRYNTDSINSIYAKNSEIPKLESESEMKLSSHQFSDKQIEPTIGIITALPKEYTAMKILLEDLLPYKLPGQGAGRRFCFGKIPSYDGGNHSVLLTLADVGNNNAAMHASLLIDNFPNVKSIIMVGIAGGIPNPDKPDEHVRLGDVVVSNYRGVIQYDFTKEEIKEIEYRHFPRPPSASLLEATRYLEASEIEGKRPWLKHINKATHELNVSRPSCEEDILISSTNPGKLIPHPDDSNRINGQPRIFFGPIASANKLLKNPVKRDELRGKFDVKAVEMEGSGIADATWNHEVGYFVVRGICDYCDTNKGDGWQQYAAIVAAAYTRALIESIP